MNKNIIHIFVILGIALGITGCSLSTSRFITPVVVNNVSSFPDGVKGRLLSIYKIEAWEYGDDISVPAYTQPIFIEPGESATIYIPSGYFYLKVYAKEVPNEFTRVIFPTDTICKITQALDLTAYRPRTMEFSGWLEIIGPHAYYDYRFEVNFF